MLHTLRRLFHHVLEIVLPKALHQIELELEHTKAVVKGISIVRTLPDLILSYLSQLP